MTGLYIGIILLIVIILYIISIYNKIISLIEETKNSKNQISIQLDRRGKVFDSLINTVKKYMDYEKTTLKDIISLRQKVVMLKNNNNSEEDIKEVENNISNLINSGEFANSFNLTMEAYPDLKANQNMIQLQEEIVSTENKLSYAKQSFNDSIERYYATKKSFPANIIVNMFSSLEQKFEYWQLDENTIKVEENKRVEF